MPDDIGNNEPVERWGNNLKRDYRGAGSGYYYSRPNCCCFSFSRFVPESEKKKNDDGILYIQLGVSGRRRKTFGEKKKEGN